MGAQTDKTKKLLAEGQAALLLIESMLLALIEAKAVDKIQVIDAIETVIAAKRALANDGDAPEVAKIAVGLLSDIANSLAAAAEGPAVTGSTLPPRS